MKMNRVAVIGGGAAGLAAAIEANKINSEVVLFEAQNILGRKILSTGNGRCNLSNVNAEGVEEVKNFFHGIGVSFYEEQGRLYPYSEQAKGIRDILADIVDKMDIEVRLDTPVEKIRYDDLTFYITTEGGMRTCEFDVVIIATGGKAAPQLGSNDSGFRFMRELGHDLISPLPGLVPFTYTDSDKKRLGMLKGVRAKAKALLVSGENEVASSVGEVQFTDYGLSGICIFDLSLAIRDLDKNSLSIVLDLAPGLSSEELSKVDLRSILPLKLAEIVTIDNIKKFKVDVNGTKGWKEAQVTMGGVNSDEVDLATMESKIVPGLFLAGEMLDVAFPCGGFNLNWAWLSGLRAGKNAAGFV